MMQPPRICETINCLATSIGKSEMSASGKNHKDIYRAFYTDDDALVSYMVDLLDPRPGQRCLEPSAGAGHFISAVLDACPEIEIIAFDISHDALRNLRNSFGNEASVHIQEQDFLALGSDLFDDGIEYDRIIANPPYGAWQEQERREWLKHKFSGLYVKESYALFVALGMEKLAAGGRAVFILPETFLYIHMQKALRSRLLQDYTITSIDVFPSFLFPGVNFGYAKLCIISIDKKRPAPDHQIQIRTSSTTQELVDGGGVSSQVNQASILLRDAHTFPLGGYDKETHLIDSYELRLGDVASCVTGIYSGNDQLFVRRAESNARGAAKYPQVDMHDVGRFDSCPDIFSGFAGSERFVPMLKGGGVRFYKPVAWYFDWSKGAVEHYKTDKKARFQNSGFYFRKGIGFPMVSSGGASASVIEPNWIFDQSVVGIFPHNQDHYWYILAFLNSEICWRLLRKINPSANNSAKYIKRLPLVLPESEKMHWFSKVVGSYVSGLVAGSLPDPEIEKEILSEVSKVYSAALSQP